MKAPIIVLAAVLLTAAGCASRNVAAREDGYSPSASPILTSQSDCLRDGYVWNAKLGVCEVRRSR